MTLFISVLSFLLIMLFILMMSGNKKNKSPLERLQDMSLPEPETYEKADLSGPIKKLSAMLPQYDNTFMSLRKNIVYSDTKYTLEEILTIKIMTASAVALLLFALSKSIVMTVMTFLFIWFMPDFVISRQAKKRMAHFNSQLADGLMIIGNALKAGYSFMQAMALVSKEMDGPLAKEFSTLLKEMSFGITMEESFANITARVDSEDLKLVVNAILIQKDVGGNLSDILDKIIDTIRERQRLKAEVKTLTAQGRLSGLIITLLPFTMALFLFFVNRDYLLLLFQNSIGIGMVIYGLISQTIGFFVIRKITDIEL